MDWGQGKVAYLEQTVPWLVVGSILHASGCGALAVSLRVVALAVHRVHVRMRRRTCLDVCL